MTTTTRALVPTTSKVARKPKTMTTNVIFIIDESGSMENAATDVRGGFNTYVETIKGDGNAYTLSAVKFNTTPSALFSSLSLSDVPRLDSTNYLPGGGTALYDAIGTAFSEAKRKWGTAKKPYGRERFICIIMTDGEENSSKHFTKEQIVASIKRRQDSGNWTFVYMGADQDAWAHASGLGFAPGNVLSYASSESAQVYSRVATSTTATSSGGLGQTWSFFNPNTTSSAQP